MGEWMHPRYLDQHRRGNYCKFSGVSLAGLPDVIYALWTRGYVGDGNPQWCAQVPTPPRCRWRRCLPFAAGARPYSSYSIPD